MPKEKYHNPQEDVVKIMDGRRVPVSAYNMYEALHAGPSANADDLKAAPKQETPFAQEGEDDLFLYFDGRNLTFVENRNGMRAQYSFGAVSGRPNEDGTFSYDKQRQYMENVGPVPEGRHSVLLDSVAYWEDLSAGNKISSAVLSPVSRAFGGPKLGSMPGGRISWGEGRVDVKLDPEVAGRTHRGGITIHGGRKPGSGGCIDLVRNDRSFFKALEELKGEKKEIPLIVDYSNTPQKVRWERNI